MAKCELLLPKILHWEGGFVNDPLDKGGATNKGITLATCQSMHIDKNGDGKIDVSDVKLLTDADVLIVLKTKFWNRWKADLIINQSIAEILVDFVWGSGTYGITTIQSWFKLFADGIVGEKTLKLINGQSNYTDLKLIHEEIAKCRLHFVDVICKNNPSQLRFKQGWINRINSYKFVNLQWTISKQK